MVKQNIAIVEYKILPNILEEIKDNLSFSIINFEKNENFFDYLSLNKRNSDNLLILANFPTSTLGRTPSEITYQLVKNLALSGSFMNI